MRYPLRMTALLLGLGMLGMTVAQAEPEKPAPAADPAQAAAMAKMKEASSPNENHKVFEPLVGKWTYTLQWWMNPEAPAQSMRGNTENSLLYGGRFLKQKVKGDPMAEGEPAFEGLLLMGYDNVRKEYQSVWLDNMMTGLMTGKGGYDAATKTLTQEGAFACPMTGETERSFRSAWKSVDTDHNVYESYSKTPEGKEFKSMEILYTRAQ